MRFVLKSKSKRKELKIPEIKIVPESGYMRVSEAKGQQTGQVSAWTSKGELFVIFCLFCLTFSLEFKKLHCTKSQVFFFQMFRKDDISKKWHWNMIFFSLSGKMIFLFHENMIIFFRRKRKDDLSKKIHGNVKFSSNVLKRWSFQKNRTGI